MSTERIEELLNLMAEHSLVELELEEGEFKVRLSKAATTMAMTPAAPMVMAPAGAAPAAAAAPAVDENADLPVIESPIVGTFYSAPSPDADPFVKVGDKVDSETVVCIVEAMKVMNEVHAGVSGTIAERLVDNGEAVEFGQPLFRIRTNG